MIDLQPLLPIARLAAGMSNREDLNFPRRSLPINQSKRKLSEQESARRVRTDCPTLRSLNDLRERAIHFCVEPESGTRATFQVPVKCGVIFGAASS